MPDTAITKAIIVIAYNRPKSIRSLLDSLSSCAEISNFPIHIFIDGPKHPAEIHKVREVFQIATDFTHGCKKTVHTRSENIGLKRSVKEAVSEALIHYEAVIVLEDDLVVGKYCLLYFREALEKFKDDLRISGICAHSPYVPERQITQQAYFLPTTHPWAWATWRDRWIAHIASTEDPSIFKIERNSYQIALNGFGIRNYSRMLFLDKRKLIDSWWIYWQATSTIGHRLFLYPSKHLAVNTGNNVGGTHSRTSIFRSLLPTRVVSDQPETIPDTVSVNFEILDQIRSSHETRIIKLIDLLGMIRRVLKGRK